MTKLLRIELKGTRLGIFQGLLTHFPWIEKAEELGIDEGDILKVCALFEMLPPPVEFFMTARGDRTNFRCYFTPQGFRRFKHEIKALAKVCKKLNPSESLNIRIITPNQEDIAWQDRDQVVLRDKRFEGGR